MAARIAIMAITTSNSIRVNAKRAVSFDKLFISDRIQSTQGRDTEQPFTLSKTTYTRDFGSAFGPFYQTLEAASIDIYLVDVLTSSRWNSFCHRFSNLRSQWRRALCPGKRPDLRCQARAPNHFV